MQEDLGEVNVLDFGATPNDSADDTAAIVAAIQSIQASGGTVRIPSGVYLVSANRGLTIASALQLDGINGVTLAGDSAETSILRMAPGHRYTGDTHMIVIQESSGIRITNLTLDGNRDNVTYGDEQSHGLEVRGSSDLMIDGAVFTNMYGDGIRLLGTAGPTRSWVVNTHIINSQFLNNGRSGVAIQRGVRQLTISGCRFGGIADQAIDMEPTGTGEIGGVAPREIEIFENHFRVNGSLALTITGVSPKDRARDVRIYANDFEASGIFVFNALDVQLSENTISAGRDWPAIEVRKACERILIEGNDIDGTMTEGPTVVITFHTSAAPKNVIVSDNSITAGANEAFYSRDAESITISRNALRGTGDSAVKIEDILPGSPLSGFLVEDNSITGFKSGISLSTRSDPVSSVCVRGNNFQALGGAPLLLSGEIEFLCPGN